MKFYYDKEKSMELMQRIEDKFAERCKQTSRGEEMHVSDLTGCQLRPYCRLVGVERIPTKQSVGTMVFGIIAEDVLGWTFPEDTLQYESSIGMLTPDENIFGHMDIFEKKIYCLEVKASRKSIFKAADVPIYWVEQLMSYMAMNGKQIGWIVIYNIFTTQIMAFRMMLTTAEILEWLIVLNNRAIAVRSAAKNKDCSTLIINPKQYGWCDYKKTCPRRSECREKSKKRKT